MHRLSLLALAVVNLAGVFLMAKQQPGSAIADQTKPAAILDVLRDAQRAQAAGNWNEAARIWGRIVELNPVQPNYWYALGVARERAKDFKNAVPAFEKAAQLGAPAMGAYYSIYEIARSYSLAGELEPAVLALQRAFQLGFPDLPQAIRDPDLALVRRDARVIEMLGLGDVSKMSRDEGWRYDLALLAREVRRKGFNPQLFVQRPVTREQFDTKVRELDAAIPRLTDGQVVLALMKLMVFVEDGHSAVWDVGEHPLFRAALPLRFFWFEEGLFVTAADPKYRDLVGSQILKFDGRASEDVLNAMAAYQNRDRGNPMPTKTRTPYLVRKLRLLHAAGLVRNADQVTLTARDLSGSVRDVVVESDTKDPEIWNTLPAPSSWVTFASTLAAPPLYVQHMDKAQWFEYLAPERTVYFQFNGVRNDPAEPLAAFADRLTKFIDVNDVQCLVIDMRWNNGGNTALSQPLLLDIISNRKVNQRGRLFVIIGRRTYSAAQNTATYFERFTNATFVGEPTGSSPNFVGEEVPLTLPYSKLLANVSHLFWQSSTPQDQRIWLAPQIYVPPTFADFRAGHDAPLAAILTLAAR
jgi:tetratricopeptide (TPR) repeat protein